MFYRALNKLKNMYFATSVWGALQAYLRIANVKGYESGRGWEWGSVGRDQIMVYAGHPWDPV